MVNAPGINSRSTSDKEGKPEACPPDNKLPENSQENLDARLDHAIEETFPTSDPVSVTITKGAGTDPHGQGASSASAQQTSSERGATEHLLDQVREALTDVAEGASETAGNVYSRGEQYMRQAGEYYPEAQHYVREAQGFVARHTTGNPLLSLVMAGALGYALAWMIHGERRNREPRVPDYGRTERGYAPHRGR